MLTFAQVVYCSASTDTYTVVHLDPYPESQFKFNLD